MHVRFAVEGPAREAGLREVGSRDARVGEAIEEGKRVREAWS